MSGLTSTEFRDRAWALADAVQTDPSLVESGAVELLDCPDVEARVVARWALGRACYELGKLAVAVTHLRTAMAASRRAQLADLEAQVRMSLAVVLIEQGFTRKGLDQLRAAEGLVHGSLLGRVLSQRSFVQCHLGRFDKAVGDADRGLVLLRAAGDHLGHARLLLNRAVAHIGAGNLRAAELDLHACRDVAARIGQQLIVAAVDHNMGAVRARQGRLPECLSFYGAAREQYQVVGMPTRVMAVLEADTAEAMSLCGLHDDATDAAGRALQLAAESGNKVQEADAHLGLARAELAGGDCAAASAHAVRATTLFRASKRVAGALAAQHVNVEAAAAADTGDSDVVSVHHAAERLCVQLQHSSMTVELADARALAGELALRVGRVDVARAHWSEIVRLRASTTLTIRAAHLEALIARADGDAARARRSLRRGLRAIAKYQASFGATEIQVQIGAQATRFARMGLQMAMERRRPWEVLAWSERARGNALRIPPTAPPADAHLSELLENLRRLHAVRREALSEDDGASPRSAADLRRAERAVLDRARAIEGVHDADGQVLKPSLLVGQLRSAVLVSFIEHDSRYAAVVVYDKTARLIDIGPTPAIDAEITYLRSGLRRLFALTPTASAGDAVAVAATRLDQLLLTPLNLPKERFHIIVPTGALHGVAWGLLPSIRDPFVVSPSIACWERAETISTSNRDGGSVGIVVGPRLEGGEREGKIIGSMYAGARIVSGSDASVAATIEMLQRHDVIHLAAHGRFRADNPLFSTLEMADGPLMLLDMQSLRRVPAILMLPSCNGGVSRIYPGDELIGTTAALLGLGAANIVAPLCAVRDDITERLMTDVHAQLARGISTSEALAACRRDWSHLEPVDRATAGVFASLGAECRYVSAADGVRESVAVSSSADRRSA
jgi:tetratricopeptide (TPR) repeat protein